MNKVEQLLLRGGRGQRVLLGAEADQLAGFLFVIDIDARRGVVADDHDREAGRYAVLLFKPQRLLSDLLLYLCRYLFAVYNLHKTDPPSFC